MLAWDKKRDIMRRYDATARIYDMRYAQEQAAKIEAALRHVTVKTEAVLDVGCGTGILFSYIGDKASISIGLDISPKALQVAKEHAKDYPNAHLICADADNMPFRDDTFDMAFAVTVIQNMPSPAKMLKEIKRVVKDDASIVITGLKKIFAKKRLLEILKDVGFRTVFMESKDLKCHVAICNKAFCSVRATF